MPIGGKKRENKIIISKGKKNIHADVFFNSKWKISFTLNIVNEDEAILIESLCVICIYHWELSRLKNE